MTTEDFHSGLSIEINKTNVLKTIFPSRKSKESVSFWINLYRETPRKKKVI